MSCHLFGGLIEELYYSERYSGNQSQLQKSEIVIPAEAGIQSFQKLLDPRIRRGDNFFDFLKLAQSV